MIYSELLESVRIGVFKSKSKWGFSVRGGLFETFLFRGRSMKQKPSMVVGLLKRSLLLNLQGSIRNRHETELEEAIWQLSFRIKKFLFS